MNTSRFPRPSPALGLGLGLILAIAPPSSAQQPSSGSGAGTGTGLEAGGAGSTGTGMEAGGLGATSGRPFMRPAGGPSIYGPAGPTGPRFDPLESPRVVVPGEVERLIGRGTEELMRDALAIADPGERSLALVRVARTSIFLGRPDFGHTAVYKAAEDAQLVVDDTLHDQRIVNVIEAALSLAEEHMRDIRVFEPAQRESPGLPAPLQPKNDRASNLERGRQEWDLAFRLAFVIRNASARTETGYRVVESESIGSASLVREPFRLLGTRPDPRRLPTAIRNFSDGLIVTAIDHATRIERPVWRDRALTAIATNAAVSGQFERAEQAAATIPQPEVRTDAYLKIAENDIIFGRPGDATKNYQAAARSIAEVPMADPRETLVGVLIDSLIAFGRFDDARASIVLYANPANPPIALAAVAESQGRRGLAKSAQEWIAREPSSEMRSLLYRKLNDGMLAAFEQKRSAELSRGAP
ncbi:MAG TPA: hypothetical protein VG406_19445 [Isosphaeraceae bacterium]|jgi:hypothetical protein|nr:hypothetical protein [Isosphaeraceae bacterium]